MISMLNNFLSAYDLNKNIVGEMIDVSFILLRKYRKGVNTGNV